MEKGVNVKELDRKQKIMAEKLKKALTEKIDNAYFIDVANCNLGYQAQREFAIYIYDNEYDFKRLDLKYLQEATVDDYILAVTNAIVNNKWHRDHKACIFEKMLTGLFSELKNMWIHEGVIYWKGEIEGIGIDDIVNYNIDTEYDELILELTDDYFFKIDLNTGKITEVKDKVEELTEQIEILNKLKPYNSDIKVDGEGYIKVRYGDDEEALIIGNMKELQEISIGEVSFNLGDETIHINGYGIEI